jgi:hypothetical protein
MTARTPGTGSSEGAAIFELMLLGVWLMALVDWWRGRRQ